MDGGGRQVVGSNPRGDVEHDAIRPQGRRAGGGRGPSAEELRRARRDRLLRDARAALDRVRAASADARRDLPRYDRLLDGVAQIRRASEATLEEIVRGR